MRALRECTNPCGGKAECGSRVVDVARVAKGLNGWAIAVRENEREEPDIPFVLPEYR